MISATAFTKRNATVYNARLIERYRYRLVATGYEILYTTRHILLSRQPVSTVGLFPKNNRLQQALRPIRNHMIANRALQRSFRLKYNIHYINNLILSTIMNNDVKNATDDFFLFYYLFITLRT